MLPTVTNLVFHLNGWARSLACTVSQPSTEKVVVNLITSFTPINVERLRDTSTWWKQKKKYGGLFCSKALQSLKSLIALRCLLESYGFIGNSNLLAKTFTYILLESCSHVRASFRDHFREQLSVFLSSSLWFSVWFLPSYQLLLGSRAAGYSYLCQPVNYSNDVNEVRVSFLQQTHHIKHICTHSVHKDQVSVIWFYLV